MSICLIPAHHIENKHDGAMDENEEYIVLQFSDSQMKDFESKLEAQGTWKNVMVVPNSLFQCAFANITASHGDPRTNFTDQSKAPMPNQNQTAYTSPAPPNATAKAIFM